MFWEWGLEPMFIVLVVHDFMELEHEFWNDIVLVTFSIAVVRYHDQDNL